MKNKNGIRKQLSWEPNNVSESRVEELISLTETICDSLVSHHVSHREMEIILRYVKREIEMEPVGNSSGSQILINSLRRYCQESISATHKDDGQSLIDAVRKYVENH